MGGAGAGGTGGMGGAGAGGSDGAGGGVAGQGGGGGPCGTITLYLDADGDGYSPPGAGTRTDCQPAAGWTPMPTQPGDCEDTVADAFPGQMKFFSTPYTQGNGSPSWDYNCDNSVTTLFAYVGDPQTYCESHCPAFFLVPQTPGENGDCGTLMVNNVCNMMTACMAEPVESGPNSGTRQQLCR
jgi:hypothetical protein